MAVIVW